MVNSRIVNATHLVRVMAVTVLATLTLAVGACGKPEPVETPKVSDFEKRIADYLEVQKKATDDLPALVRTDDPVEITQREVAMGESIRAARANAKPGDIMTPEIAAQFRKLIKADFDSRTDPEKKMMKDEIPPFPPALNQTYPSDHPLATFPATLLSVMPTLPDGLEYRFLINALIIRDIKANIIVDYILDVF